MYTLSRTLVLPLSLSLNIAVFGCGKDKDELPPGASAANEVGRPLTDIELPVSLRTGDAAPSNARQVEATDEQLRLDGDVIAELERGRVAKSDRSDGIIPKLEAALRAPVSTTLALRLQANLPYETTALVLNTAKKVGMRDAAFQVRKTGSSQQTGWLRLDGYIIASKDQELPAIPGAEARSWNDFTTNWQGVFDGCRTTRTGNCAYVNENFAQGGTLRSELFASGRGININFYRRGLTAEQEQVEAETRSKMLAVKKEDFLQGRITEEELVEHILLGDPSTYALFQFRYAEALKAPSGLTATMAPMCHSGKKCGIVLTADAITPLLNVVSLVGAAFPDGTQAPGYAVELPWTERPKPPDLAAFIEEQSQL
jgi:hypothetical protein